MRSGATTIVTASWKALVGFTAVGTKSAIVAAAGPANGKPEQAPGKMVAEGLVVPAAVN